MMYPIVYDGLSGLVDALINNWIGPVFILAVAVFAIYFIKERKVRELATFILVAAVVGVCVYLGSFFFGRDGRLTGAAKKVGESVNTAFIQVK